MCVLFILLAKFPANIERHINLCISNPLNHFGCGNQDKDFFSSAQSIKSTHLVGTYLLNESAFKRNLKELCKGKC